MIQISLCMIVKNEENILSRCLDSVSAFVDEIIIVDTGSMDKTKEIAQRYDAKIYDFQWCDDFSKARNFSFSKATKDYIFWLDADDYIADSSLKKLIELKNSLDNSIDIVSMNYSLERNSNGETTYSLRRNRLVKRKMGYIWKGRIHEYLDVIGKAIHSDISINHDKDKPYNNRNIGVFRLMKSLGEEFSHRDRFYYANELYQNGEYEEALQEYEIFIDDGRGWVEDLKTATANLNQCYTFANQEVKKMDSILNSFKWGMPRADICCQLAEQFIIKNDLNAAIFWYKTAKECRPTSDNMGIDVKDYYTWIPNIQLCVCYTNIGDFKTAYYYNEVTAFYIPSSDKVAHNRVFLREKLLELGLGIPSYECILKEQI